MVSQWYNSLIEAMHSYGRLLSTSVEMTYGVYVPSITCLPSGVPQSEGKGFPSFP
jgi:hypothetical protein